MGRTGMGYCIHTGQHVQLAYFAIPIAVMATVAVLERVHPLDRSWNVSRGDLQPDIASIAIVALGIETVLRAISPAVGTAILIAIGLSDHAAGLSGALPLWLEAVVVLLVVEFGKYWFHRLSHTTDELWPLHSVHHSVKRMHLLNGFRIHPLYHLVNHIVGVMPAVLLGASAEALILHTVVLSIGAAIQHANIKLRFGPLNYVFNTNELHRWHHSKLVDEANWNYGAVLSVFDVLFGTFRLRLHESPAELGIADEETYPMNNYWKQLVVPFRYQQVVAAKPDPSDDAANSAPAGS